MRYFEVISVILKDIETTQAVMMEAAAHLIANSIMNGGFLLAFGSGHSHIPALDICERAGGLIPSRAIREPAGGIYEAINGVGEIFVSKWDVRPQDVVIVVSNSGRNPLPITVAAHAQKVGAKVIIVTAKNTASAVNSRHHDGSMLHDYGDVVLDMCVPYGDASLNVDGLDIKVGGTSSIAASALLQEVMLQAIELMVQKGFEVPIFMSGNLDEAKVHNEKAAAPYRQRLMRF